MTSTKRENRVSSNHLEDVEEREMFTLESSGENRQEERSVRFYRWLPRVGSCGFIRGVEQRRLSTIRIVVVLVVALLPKIFTVKEPNEANDEKDRKHRENVHGN